MSDSKPLDKPPVDLASQSLSEALNLSFKILKFIMVCLVVLFLTSGSFTVEHDQVAIVLRFGKVVGTKADRVLESGFHWTWPLISEVVKIRVGRQHFLEVEEFLYEDKIKEMIGKVLDPERDGYALTKTRDIIHFKGNIEYKISDPYLYKMHHSYPKTMLKNIICNAIVKASSQFSINDILKDNPEKLRQLVKTISQQKTDEVELGIQIINVNLTGEIPHQVKDAFESVTQAQTESNNRITSARTYTDKMQNEATAESAQIVNEADNYAQQIYQQTKSDAKYFEQLIQQFRKHPDILAERYYQATMERVSEQIREVFMLSSSVDKQRLYLRINRNPSIHRTKPAKEE